MTGIKKLALYIALLIIMVISLCCAVCFTVSGSDSKIAYAESSDSVANVGDVYSDGVINSKDAVYLMQYLANMDSAKDINLTNANTYVEDNSDGGTINVNSKDAVLLMQYLAKMDVTMGVGEWYVKSAPTESSAGTLARKTAAGIETATLPALNTTDYTKTVKSQATCIAHEIFVYKYTKDGTTFTFEAEGTTYGEHVSSAWITVQAATCEESGLKHKVCTVCGEELETETLEALGHDYGEWTVSVEPTLTSTGKLVKTCANDSLHTQTATLPALNQTDYVYTLVSQSTCATAGQTTYSYSKDGQYFVFSVALEKLAHTEVVDAAVSATCYSMGLTEGSHCSVCGTIIVQQSTTAIVDHDYSVETWQCTMCGKNKYNEYTSYNDFCNVCTVSESSSTITILYNSTDSAGLNLNKFSLSSSKTYVFEFGNKASDVKISGNGNSYNNVRIVIDSTNFEFNLVLDSIALSNSATVLTSKAATLNLGFYGSSCSISTTKGATGSTGASYSALQVGNGGDGGNGGNATVAVVCSGKLNIICGTNTTIKGGDGGTGGTGGNSSSSGSTGGTGGNGGNGAMAITADQINVSFVLDMNKSNISIKGGSGGAGGAGGYGSLLFGLGKTYASDGASGSSAHPTNVDINYL